MQTKVMRPQDVKAYCDINPQAIREGLKAGRLPFGFAAKKEGSSRWTYCIIPKKFFEYIGQPVPPEWEVSV